MHRILLTILLLIFTVGCAGTLPEPGLPDASNDKFNDKVVVDEKHLPAIKTAAQDRKGNMSVTVMTLLGIGAAAQLGAVLSMNVGEGSNDPLIPLVLFGSGLSLWGAAGITYLIEECCNEPEEDKSP